MTKNPPGHCRQCACAEGERCSCSCHGKLHGILVLARAKRAKALKQKAARKKRSKASRRPHEGLKAKPKHRRRSRAGRRPSGSLKSLQRHAVLHRHRKARAGRRSWAGLATPLASIKARAQVDAKQRRAEQSKRDAAQRASRRIERNAKRVEREAAAAKRREMREIRAFNEANRPPKKQRSPKRHAAMRLAAAHRAEANEDVLRELVDDPALAYAFRKQPHKFKDVPGRHTRLEAVQEFGQENRAAIDAAYYDHAQAQAEKKHRDMERAAMLEDVPF